MKKEKERTLVPAFFSRQPSLPHAQKFSSSPMVIPSPRSSLDLPFPAPNATHSPADTSQSGSSEPPLSVAKTPRDAAPVTRQLSDTVTNSIPPIPRTIRHNSSFNLPRPAKLPGSPAKTIGSQKKKSSAPEASSSCCDYKLQPSPLQFPSSCSKERSPSLLVLGDTESTDAVYATALFQLYLFIFNFSFGNDNTRKECLAKFFNSNAMVDPRISDPLKQYFYKLILQTLNELRNQISSQVKAKMLLGDSIEEEKRLHLEESLRYLNEEMPNPKDNTDVEAYIRAIANGQPSGEFPYSSTQQEKYDFLRYALQQNYDFFEYIFTENDISPTEEINIFLKIQSWLYHSLSYQFILSKNEGVLEEIRSELSRDDEDKNEEEIQIPSPLEVAYSDLQQALYQHLKTLLKKNKSLSTSSIKTAFLLVYQLSFEWIHKNTEEAELNALFDLLLQIPAGIRFLCAVKDAGKELPMEKWLNLLEKKRKFKLFDKILSILPRLSSKQVLTLLDSTLMDILTDYLAPKQELQLLNKLLELNLSIVDMHICEDSELMQIAKKLGLVEMLRKRIWHSFSLESLENEDNEIRRAFLSDDRLIVENNKILAELLDCPVLNTFLLEKFHNIQFVLEINALQHDWIIAYKKICHLILDCWRPNDKDLYEINRIKEEWSNSMTKKLSEKTSDCSAYHPQNYTVDTLPQTMRAALEDKIEVLKLYQEQLGIMADCHHRLIACVRVPYSADTPSSARENRIPFIELIGTLAAQKKIKCTEAQIQACAEDLSRWFKEVISTGEVYPLEPMFFGLTKNSFKAANVLYLSTWYAELFLELLENAMPKKSSFSMFLSTGIVLREKETKDAINAFLLTLIEQKQIEQRPKEYSDSFRPVIVVRGTPKTPLLESKINATPFPVSPFSPPSPKS